MCTTHSTQDAHVEIVGTFLFSFLVSSKLNTSLMGFFFNLKGCLTHNPGRFSVLWQRLAGDWDQVAPEQLLDELTQPPNEAERCNTRGYTATHIHRRVQIDYSENTASLQSWEVIQWNICRDTRCVGPTRSPKKKLLREHELRDWEHNSWLWTSAGRGVSHRQLQNTARQLHVMTGENRFLQWFHESFSFFSFFQQDVTYVWHPLWKSL